MILVVQHLKTVTHRFVQFYGWFCENISLVSITVMVRSRDMICIFFSCSCYMMFRRKLCRLNKQKKLSIFLQDLEILIHGADSKYVLISRAALPHFAFGVLAVCHICLWACQYFDPQLLRDSVLAWAPSLSRISNLIPQLCPCLVLVFGYPGSWGRIQFFIE